VPLPGARFSGAGAPRRQVQSDDLSDASDSSSDRGRGICKRVARRFVFRSVLAVGAGSLVAACYWITPYSDLTEGDGADAAPADAALADAARASDASDAAPVDPDLLGYWTFDGDEDGIARDRSGMSHDLLLENAIVGAPGYDGGEGLQYPDGTGLAHSDALGMIFPPAGTLSVWAFFPPPASELQREIFDGYDSSRHHLYLRSSGQGDAATELFDVASQTGTGYELFSRAAVPVGQWTHLVLTWDHTTAPNSLHFYVDGAASVGNTFPPSDASVSQLFAVRNGYAGSYDDLALWKRAFSEEEVRELP
jgi:hypothetical protein